MKKLLAIIVGITVLTSTTWNGKSWSQDVAETPSVPSVKGAISLEALRTANLQYRMRMRWSDHLSRLLDDLSKTIDPTKKAKLTKQLTAEIANSFDEDLRSRDEELSRLQLRLNNLRAQIDRRRKAKSEIIQLEVKVLSNEADGLGFSALRWNRINNDGRVLVHTPGDRDAE